MPLPCETCPARETCHYFARFAQISFEPIREEFRLVLGKEEGDRRYYALEEETREWPFDRRLHYLLGTIRGCREECRSQLRFAASLPLQSVA